MPRVILHVDMDAFYASVEQRDNPSLRGKPVIVGGHPTRGVVLAASYEVRPFGVRSAMPMSRAVKLAPHAVVVPPHFSAYVEASEEVFGIFEQVTPLVEPLSLDEAFLDVTASTGLFGSPARIAEEIRRRIRTELHLTASAGIAAVKFVSKIASDLAKPDGQKEVPADQTRSFLAVLPVSRLWGVGPKTEEVLKGVGILTIGDIATRDPDDLQQRLGIGGRDLWELAHGRDDRVVVPDREAKSIGSEDTFEEDIDDLERLKPLIHSQALRVARRLRRSGLKGRVVQLKLKYSDFQLATRRTTLDPPTDDGQLIYRCALDLLQRSPLERAVRLTGVASHDFGAPDDQLALFPEQPTRDDRLNAALDRIAAKFGNAAVTTADLAGEEEDEDRRLVGASQMDSRRPR
jgi:DNA polymerase-4